MRKIKRFMMKNEARKSDGKTLKVFKEMWNKYQIKKYGYELASLYKKIGTGKTFKSRMLMIKLSKGRV